MKTVIEMAREAEIGDSHGHMIRNELSNLERFAELVRADERNSWPSEMEAMERQVNILTDALAKARANEREKCEVAAAQAAREAIVFAMDAEREACAQLCEGQWQTAHDIQDAIRARSNT